MSHYVIEQTEGDVATAHGPYDTDEAAVEWGAANLTDGTWFYAAGPEHSERPEPTPEQVTEAEQRAAEAQSEPLPEPSPGFDDSEPSHGYWESGDHG